MSQTPPPARRRAARPRRPVAFDWTAVAAGLLLAVAGASTALTRPAAQVAGPSAREKGTPVTHAVVACPSGRPAAGARSTVVGGAAPASGLGGGGSVRLGHAAGSGATLPVRRGRLLDLTGRPGEVLTGDGQLAAGLFGFREDRATGSSTLAVTRCAGPQGSWWFTGAGGTLDHSSELVLTNVDVGPAVVDLHLLGGSGPADTVGTRGITLQPGETRRVPLTDIAPQVGELALGVSASRGRVVAAVSDSFAATPGGPVGREWLVGDTAPSRIVRLAGLPGRATSRQLLIANPSDREAVVETRVSGRGGQFVPAGLDEQTVAPGSVRTVDLGGLGKGMGRGEAVSVRLRSQVPILATVRSRAADDTAYAAPARPLVDPAVVPVPAQTRSTVQLTAGALPATASLVAYDGHGRRVDRHRLTLRPTSTAGWSPSRRAAYVVVTPVDGRVFGAAVYQGGGLSATPLTTLPVRYLEPTVVPAVH